MKLKKLIALDIGHGENTQGKAVPGLKEHHFNSDVGQRAKRKLERLGFDVYYPQEPYSNVVDLNKRINDANNNFKPDLYYSIHANANFKASVFGACCFFWHTSSNGRKLAEIHAKNLEKMGVALHGNGIHESEKGSWTNLAVCRKTHMTGFLAEFGFMTNPDDLKRLLSDEYRELCAEIIVMDICEFFNMEYSKEPLGIPFYSGDDLEEKKYTTSEVLVILDEVYDAVRSRLEENK